MCYLQGFWRTHLGWVFNIAKAYGVDDDEKAKHGSGTGSLRFGPNDEDLAYP